MSWILIVWMTSYGWHYSVSITKFQTKSGCEAVLKEVFPSSAKGTKCLEINDKGSKPESKEGK